MRMADRFDGGRELVLLFLQACAASGLLHSAAHVGANVRRRHDNENLHLRRQMSDQQD
jgi:hypothetical protein